MFKMLGVKLFSLWGVMPDVVLWSFNPACRSRVDGVLNWWVEMFPSSIPLPIF